MADGFVWAGDLGDDCFCKSVPGYLCHAEDMGDGKWFAGVDRVPGVGVVLSSFTDGIIPRSGSAARRLCEMAVLADMALRGGADAAGGN